MSRYIVKLGDSSFMGPLSAREIGIAVAMDEIPREAVATFDEGQSLDALRSSQDWMPLQAIPEIDEAVQLDTGTLPPGTCAFRIFRGGSFTSWETLADEVARFLTELGPKRVVSVGQSEDSSRGCMIVWYWT